MNSPFTDLLVAKKLSTTVEKLAPFVKREFPKLYQKYNDPWGQNAVTNLFIGIQYAYEAHGYTMENVQVLSGPRSMEQPEGEWGDEIFYDNKFKRDRLGITELFLSNSIKSLQRNEGITIGDRTFTPQERMVLIGFHEAHHAYQDKSGRLKDTPVAIPSDTPEIKGLIPSYQLRWNERDTFLAQMAAVDAGMLSRTEKGKATEL